VSEFADLILGAFDRVQARASSIDLAPDAFAVEAVREGYYVGSSADGALALLVETTPVRSQPAPTRLEYLSASYGIQCDLHEQTSARKVRVSKLLCVDVGPGTRDLFATVCAAIADKLGREPTEQQFADEIARWATLFWRLGQSVATDLVGLVGELAVISCMDDPAFWIAAWHSSPGEVLDFEFGGSGTSVEVKATRGAAREHSLSLEQVSSRDEHVRYFASVLVDLSDSGQAIGQLVREISDRLVDDVSRLRFWDILTKTCGIELEETLARRIETSKILSSVQFYPAWLVPRPDVGLPLPKGVRSVKFTSDFTVVPAVDRTAVSQALRG